MKTHFYINSEDAWTAMLHAIKEAHTSIYWEIYIFQNDTLKTHDFVGAMEEAARRGVEVKLVADSFGSYNFDKKSISRLREAGAEIIFYNHPLWRTHRKLLIIDERIAFFGGVNIGDTYRKWTDLHVRTTAKRVIRGLLTTFARFYSHCGGTDESVLAFSKHARKRAHQYMGTRDVQDLIFEHLPNMGKRRLAHIYREQLTNAKKHITIVSPSFIPAPWLKKLLLLRVQEGVRVEIILPQSTSPKYLNPVHYLAARDLSKEGISFYFTKQMMHAKVLLIDGKIGLVGSQNLDPISFGLTMETGVFFHDKASLTKLRHIIYEWRTSATKYDPTLNSSRWYDPLVRIILRILSPLFY
ncbi:MAG: phosphatidylserine/phosphatidylglycerophosphate/cardiolipin synthase family protein [bacterium]|nr:phosphatidylserine/phosphatidylglycerophosphate/cardiolipin synthase family protein [bacterium]